MSRLSNQQKSARRYEVMNKIAEQFAKDNEGFRYFLIVKGENTSALPTWRRLETFIKQQFEQGNNVRIMIESAASGD